MNALESAFTLADDLRSRAAFAKAADTSGSAVLTGGSYSGAVGYNSLGQAREQYAHNKGWVYVAVKAIAQRIAGQSVYVGRIQSRPSGRKLILPRSFKSVGEYIEPLPTHELLTALNDP